MSNAMFSNNPLSWWDTEPADKAEANIKKILQERAVDGFSFYDWINFCDYYGSLIFRVCELIVAGEIKPASKDDDIVPIVEELLLLIRQVNIFAQTSEDLPTGKYDERRRIDTAISKLEKTIIRQFLGEVLPTLPFVDKYIVPNVDRYNLVNPADYDMMGSFMMLMLKNGVSNFRTGHGYPGKYDTFENWVTILDYIVNNLPLEGKPIPEHALDLIVENYISLWD